MDFINLFAMSIVIGMIFGFAAGYLTKRLRFIAKASAILESFILICFAMCSYFISELKKCSGIVTLLTTAVIMAHYAWHNLSPQGKHVTSVTFQTLGFGAEAMVFVFVGLTVTYYAQKEICWKFVIAEFFIVIIGRFGAIFISYYMFGCCRKENAKLTVRQLAFIAYAALIRGAIAFGLVTNIDEDFKDKEVIVTSTLILVISTTIIFGSFTPLVQKILLTNDDDKNIVQTTIVNQTTATFDGDQNQDIK